MFLQVEIFVLYKTLYVSYNRRMAKELTKQVNWRLPKTLIEELKSVARETGETQTEVVRDAIKTGVESKRRLIERLKGKADEAVVAG